MSRILHNLQEYRGCRGSPVSWSGDYRLCFSIMQERIARCREQLPEALRLLEQMVSMESPSFDKGLTDRFVSFIGEQFHHKFHQTGAQVEIIPAEKFGNHLRVEFPATSNKRILLLGHSDTVWPAGEIAKRGFKIEAGRALGPGVFDMKSGILL